MKNKQELLKKLALLASSSFVIAAPVAVHAKNTPYKSLGNGSEVRSELVSNQEIAGGEGKCGEGSCGEGTCGEGSCGGSPKDEKDRGGEGKCGEGSCGA